MRWLSASRLVQRGSLYTLLFLLPISKAAIAIACVVLLVSWLIEQILTSWTTSLWRVPGSRWVRPALIAYLVVCALSLAMSNSLVISPHGLLVSLRSLIGKALKYVVMFVIAADLAKDPVVARRCVAVVMASAALVVADALAQEFLGRDLFYGHPLSAFSRMTGPYENPVDLATYLIVVIPMIVVRCLSETGRRSWFFGGFFLILGGCVIRTASQGAWLGLAVGLAVLFVFVRRLRMPLVLCTAAVLVMGAWLLATGHLRGSLDTLALGMQDRLYMWQAAVRMIQDRPILGHGLNTFMANYLEYWTGGEWQPRYAHNCFLQLSAETGLGGLATCLWLLGAVMWSWWRTIRSLPDSAPTRLMVLGLGAGLLGFLVQSAFDTNFYSLRQATLFWTLAGFTTGLALDTLQRSTRKVSLETPHANLVTS